MALPAKRVSIMHENRIERLTNCYLLRNHAIVKEDLWIRRGKILNPENVFYGERKTPESVIDCGGALIAPGFIDLQINGGFGVDFTHELENVDAGVTKVAKGIIEHGVTAFCPTIVSSASEVYKLILPRLRKRMGTVEGAAVLGIHLEGPFINPERRGAHDEAFIQNGFQKGFESVNEMYGAMSNVILITLAPEMPNALDVIEKLCSEKIVVSLGHSMADYKCGESAVRRGASFLTHVFNAMAPFHHRDPGLIGLIGCEPPIRCGLIADGTHTHPAAIRIVHRTNPDGVVLVSDAISALGLPEGKHHLGKSDIDVRGGKAYIADTDTLCGSISSFIECVKYFKEASGCSIVEALEAGTLHPARVLKIDRLKGTLNYGADADFILLNNNLDIIQTWIGGKRVYKNESIEDYIFTYKPGQNDEPIDVSAKRSTTVYFRSSATIYEA